VKRLPLRAIGRLLSIDKGQELDNAHRIVSSEAEQLILVDADDNETGFLSKAEAHDGGGVLHRAFSVFLLNENGELLMQQRAASKRLWPGYWSNSCCSHPRRGETMEVATRRRLRDELNVEAELEFVYKFSYEANFGDAGSENELCHVYLGRVSGDVHANDHEIAATRFVSARELAEEMNDSPGVFTPWFKQEWEELKRMHSDRLASYGAKL
jgi:isopentenyl-diphosphate delta-isomerase